jgi:3-oxoacyl-[acyl-carrier protein] reductase
MAVARPDPSRHRALHRDPGDRLCDDQGALNVFSRSLAHPEGARGITVNAVSPGITETDMNSWLDESKESARRVADMTALGRAGQPAGIADAVAFFASDEARWITGQTVEVNGGLFLGARIQHDGRRPAMKQ